MAQQVCDVSSLASQPVWMRITASILGFVSGFSVLSTSCMNVLVKAAEQACPNLNTLERERASQMAQQVCDVSKSGVSTSLANPHRILGFVPSFLLHLYERLGCH
jgi:hypothetical protein